MHDDVFFALLCERVFLGLGLLFAALAIIMSSVTARARAGEGADVT